ncbi:hypothetical protein ACFYPG_25630 [Micromonospora sp. NPDC005553]|uniref:hypothetical protein n=1 Tax=Micromonospora sp. NPDC005553 TaxID=3364232 RepID=UPI0036C598EF
MFKLLQRKRSDDRSTFVDDVLRGAATLDQIDDYIDRWHDSPAGSPASSMELHEFLGMTWEEYRTWGERPESLRFIMAAHRARKPLPEILRADRALGAAARSSNTTDAEQVLAWLKSRGRIG